jgi:hypothetical protein
MRFKGQHTRWQAPMPGFVFQQRQHGLVTTVHPIEIADGQCTRGSDATVMNASENLHGLGRGFVKVFKRKQGILSGIDVSARLSRWR